MLNTSRVLLFVDIFISQGSVAIHFKRRWEIWHGPCCKFTAEFNGKRIF